MQLLAGYMTSDTCHTKSTGKGKRVTAPKDFLSPPISKFVLGFFFPVKLYLNLKKGFYIKIRSRYPIENIKQSIKKVETKLGKDEITNIFHQ